MLALVGEGRAFSPLAFAPIAPPPMTGTLCVSVEDTNKSKTVTIGFQLIHSAADPDHTACLALADLLGAPERGQVH